jgi:magnesium-transporting ATPase (P-type)
MQQGFLLQILLLAQHVSRHHYARHQELKSIIQWLLPVGFRAVVFKLLVWCGAEGYVSGLQDACWFSNNTFELLMIVIVVPETC